MLKIYPAVFLGEEDGYSVTFPDPPGCQTQGDTMEEAVEMAQAALGLYLAALKEDGTVFPEAVVPSAVSVGESEFVVMIATEMRLMKQSCEIKQRRANR